MLAGCFPLVTTAMFHRMTFAGASSFLGGVAALLTIVPWVLVFFGTRIRARSAFAKVCITIPFILELLANSINRKLWQLEEL